MSDELNNIIHDPEMVKAMDDYGRKFVAYLTQNLIKMDKVASGRLINSLDYRLRKVIDKLVIELESEDYLKEVDEGQKPGAFGFTQKNRWKIMTWMQQKGIGDSKSKWPISYTITKNIWQFGVKPTNVIDKTLKQIEMDASLYGDLENSSLNAISKALDKVMIELTNNNSGNLKITYK